MSDFHPSSCVCVLPRKSAEWVSGRRLFHFWKRHQYSWWQVCRDKTTWHKAWNKKSTLPFSLRFNFCHFFWGGDFKQDRKSMPPLFCYFIFSYTCVIHNYFTATRVFSVFTVKTFRLSLPAAVSPVVRPWWTHRLNGLNSNVLYFIFEQIKSSSGTWCDATGHMRC